MSFATRRFQRELDTRAVELAARTQEAHDLHVIECRDRYLQTASELREIKSVIEVSRTEREASVQMLSRMLWRTAGGTIGLLLLIIGYLLTHATPWATLGSH